MSLRILTSPSGTPAVQLILVIVGRDSAPGASGINPDAAVVSFAAVDERKHAAVTN